MEPLRPFASSATVLDTISGFDSLGQKVMAPGSASSGMPERSHTLSMRSLRLALD